jgi:Uncharacterised nucleotidyltransferase
MNPETNLVVLCARMFLSDSELSSLRSALTAPLNWALLEQSAQSNAMMPLVAYVLTQHGTGLIPQGTLKKLQERLLRTAQKNLAWLPEWLRVLDALADSRIPVISFKGPVLALMAYRNLALREFADLDLLVRPRDVVRARDVLVHNGYVLNSIAPDDTDAALNRFADRQISFAKNDNHEIKLDLHWGVLPEWSSFQLDVGSLFESAFVERLERISFLSLPPEHLLLLLCAHGTKHCWSNLRLLCDVACHVQSNPNLDWNLCVRLAEPGGDLVMKHSLLLTGRVLGLQLPERITQYAGNDAKAHWLAGKAQTFLFREDRNRSPYLDDRTRYLQVLRYRLALEEGQRFRRGAALVFRRAFIPNEADWRSLRLPRPLYFLYYLFRPIRLVVERLSIRRVRLDGR